MASESQQTEIVHQGFNIWFSLKYILGIRYANNLIKRFTIV